jgi:hypothetical protein
MAVRVPLKMRLLVACLGVAISSALVSTCAVTAPEVLAETPDPPAPTVTVSTPGCASAATWRIGYRVYFTSGELSFSPDLFEALVHEAGEFANIVGEFSECGLRVEIDIFNMGDTQYKAGNDSGAPDEVHFVRRGGYDGAFYVFPYSGRAYTGWTSYTTGETASSSYFPHSVKQNRDQAQAWSLFLMHEFLHQVVHFYRHVSWPADDVHGAIRHGYRSSEYGEFVNPNYFRDLMSGKVEEDGKLLGIRPEQYAYYGVPSQPLRY